MRSFALRLLVFPALIAAMSLASAVPAQADPTEAEVRVVHAVPGLMVDVYVNGALTLPSFAPGTVTDALPLPAGTYDIVIVAAGGDPAQPVIAGSAALAAGDRATLVAHLAADGTPTLTPFADNLTPGARGQGRLIVRHVAAAPAVDVGLERRIWRWLRPAGTLENLVSGTQTDADVAAGRYRASIRAAGTDTVAFGPADVRVRRDRATIVYAIGDLAGGSFDLIVESRSLRAKTANVTVVHGILGLPVDVYVDGALALPGFTPTTITDVLALPCGEHDIAIVPAGGNPAMPALAATVDLEAGSDTTLFAHLSEAGAPTLSALANDLSRARRGSRVVVRHGAAAPAVDVRLERSYRWWRWTAGVIRNVVNGNQAGASLWAGHYKARVTPAGMRSTTVLGPATLDLDRGTATFVYAIGSLTEGTLQLLVQVRPLR